MSFFAIGENDFPYLRSLASVLHLEKMKPCQGNRHNRQDDGLDCYKDVVHQDDDRK
jgi:hypothetical protein